METTKKHKPKKPKKVSKENYQAAKKICENYESYGIECDVAETVYSLQRLDELNDSWLDD